MFISNQKEELKKMYGISFLHFISAVPMKYLVQLPARVCSKIATRTDKFMTNITKSQTKGEGIISNLSDYV